VCEGVDWKTGANSNAAAATRVKNNITHALWPYSDAVTVSRTEPFLDQFPRLFTAIETFKHPAGIKKGIKADQLFTIKERINNSRDSKISKFLVDYAIINAYNSTNSTHNEEGIGKAAQHYAVVDKYHMYEQRWKFSRDSLYAMVMDCHGHASVDVDPKLKLIAKQVANYYQTEDVISKAKYAEILCKLRSAIGAACQVKLAIACKQIMPALFGDNINTSNSKGTKAATGKQDQRHLGKLDKEMEEDAKKALQTQADTASNKRQRTRSSSSSRDSNENHGSGNSQMDQQEDSWQKDCIMPQDRDGEATRAFIEALAQDLNVCCAHCWHYVKRIDASLAVAPFTHICDHCEDEYCDIPGSIPKRRLREEELITEDEKEDRVQAEKANRKKKKKITTNTF